MLSRGHRGTFRLSPMKAYHRQLPLPGKVYGFREDARGFLGGVEAHRVLGVDEINAELGLALESIRRRRLGDALHPQCDPSGSSAHSETSTIN